MQCVLDETGPSPRSGRAAGLPGRQGCASARPVCLKALACECGCAALQGFQKTRADERAAHVF